MASEKSIMEVIALLVAAYPLMNRDDQAAKSARLRVFKAVFTDLDDGALVAGTLQLIAERTSDFAPSVGAIRARALEIADQAAGTQAIDEYEAWSLTQRVIGALGRDASADEIRAYLVRKAGEHTAQIVATAIERIGWRTLCNDHEDNANTLRAQFRDTVKAIQARERTDRQTLPQVRQITQALAARLDLARPRQIEGGHNDNA